MIHLVLSNQQVDRGNVVAAVSVLLTVIAVMYLESRGLEEKKNGP